MNTQPKDPVTIAAEKLQPLTVEMLQPKPHANDSQYTRHELLDDLCGIAGLALLVWFDWRVGFGMALMLARCNRFVMRQQQSA